MREEEERLAMEEKSKSRKEKRKERKKMKRKQIRIQMAEKERQEVENRLNDPDELRRLEELEREERERMERDRREFEERERLWFQALEKQHQQEQIEAQEEASTTQIQVEKEDGNKEDDEWEYVEEGPPEIIWQGNEIIVRKKKVRVPKKDLDQQNRVEDADRPTSNPLPPQSEAFAEYQNAGLVSAQQILENVAQQVPNFGTEQDKAHCPFHLKTGACRFGERCSRVHFYPDKACTLLIRNMYNGPGLVWEQDEGLEHTDEEVECCYEEFYEDVHTEFLKYGEIINFKVCKNSSPHLRGNVYVHYKSLDSAVLAFRSINGRYFAGKQLNCEFVNVTRWKVAICGEYMKSRLKTCSRGVTCNFIHCFRNPGGDYEWADWDKPPPRFWVKKMAALFGYSDESPYYKETRQEMTALDRHHARRSRSRDIHQSSKSSDREDNVQDDNNLRLCRSNKREPSEIHDEKAHEGQRKTHRHYSRSRSHYDNSDRRWSESDGDTDSEEYKHQGQARKRSRQHSTCQEEKTRYRRKASSLDIFRDDMTRAVNVCTSEDQSYGHKNKHRSHHRSRKRSGSEIIVSEVLDNHLDRYRTSDTDSCHDQLESSNSRCYNHASKRLQHTEADLSANGRETDEKSHSRGHAVAKSHPKRDTTTDMRSRTRVVHLSRESDVAHFPSDVMQRTDHVGQHNLKRKSRSPDSNSIQGIDVLDRWQPESPESFRYSGRESSSVEGYDSGSPDQFNRKSKLHNPSSDYLRSERGIDAQLEPGKNAYYHRKNASDEDDRQYSRNSRFEDKNADDFNRSRSRSSSQRRRKRHARHVEKDSDSSEEEHEE